MEFDLPGPHPSGRLGEETRDRMAERALPAPGLAHDPEHAASGHLERHVPQGVDVAGARLVVQGQVVDPEQGVRHGARVPPRLVGAADRTVTLRVPSRGAGAWMARRPG